MVTTVALIVLYKVIVRCATQRSCAQLAMQLNSGQRTTIPEHAWLALQTARYVTRVAALATPARVTRGLPTLPMAPLVFLVKQDVQDFVEVLMVLATLVLTERD